MKINEFQVQDYGVFTGWGLSFDESPFHVIYGPNEAGKSTLLELLREMLFGFNRKCAYHDIREAPAAASMACVLSDGTSLHFAREKRKSPSATELTGTLAGGHPLDEERLSALLGNADRALFETVFAFSLKELALGQEAIKKANVAERIFSIGAGGLTRFTRVREELHKTLDTLLKPHGRNQALNVAWSRFDTAEKALRKSEIIPRELSKLKKEFEAAEKAHAAAKEAFKKANTEHARLDKLGKAHEQWRNAEIAKAELAELPESDGFPLSKADLFKSTTESLAQAETRRRDAEEELADVRDELAETSDRLDPDLLAVSVHLATFQQELSRMRGIRESLPRLEASTEAQARSIAAQVRELHHGWTIEDLESLLRFDKGVHIEFGQWRDEFHKSDTDLSHAKEALAQCETELKRIRAKLDNIDAVTCDEMLESLAARAKDYHLDAQKAEQTGRVIAQTDRQIRELRSRLAVDVGRPVEAPLEGLPVPSKATVEEWAERFVKLSAALEDASGKQKHREETLAEAGDLLSKLQADEAAPDRSTLARDRTRRNATWTLIRRRFIENESVSDEELAAHVAGAPSSTPGPIADFYEREVIDADNMADACFAQANAISRREQAEEMIRREKTALTAAREARCDVESQMEKARTEWETLWKPSELTPQSPNVMRSWLDDFARLNAICNEKADLADEAAAVQKRLDAYESELDAALDDTSGSIETRLDRAGRRIRAAGEANTQRQTYQEQIEQLTEQRSQLERRAEEAAQRRKEVELKVAARRNECALPPSWDLDTITVMLQKIRDLVDENDRRRDDCERLASNYETWRDFEKQARDLAARIAPDLAEGDVLQAVETLAARRSAAETAKTAHDKISQTEKAIERRLKDETKKCEEYEAILDELRTAAGAESDEEFLEKAATARARDELSRLIEDNERMIRKIAYPEPEATFREALDGLDIDALPSDLVDAARNVEEAEVEAERAHAAALEAKKALAELDTREDAIKKAVDVENHRATLLQTLDTWAPLCLADRLMDDAVARFEREKQPELLRRTAEWFRAMTAGRYVDVKTKIESRGDLFVVDTRGRAKTPGQLSTGTREQLYLALRLSFVEHYCRRSEPLPLIFDDILVNFDDRRERETLAALAAEIPQSIQVLFLTCHEETRRRAEEAWGGACKVHELV